MMAASDPSGNYETATGVHLGGVPPPWWTADPTENVKALVEADRRREDDLRSMQISHDRELRLLDASRQDEKAELRATHALEMRKAEADRIDAIRAVDVGAVQRAAEVQQAQANTLAGQVATTADAFRASLTAALVPIQNSIDDLRRAQYEAQGQKTQVVEASSSDRDAVAIEQARIQAAQARMQMYALVIAAVILALSIYAAFHK